MAEINGNVDSERHLALLQSKKALAGTVLLIVLVIASVLWFTGAFTGTSTGSADESSVIATVNDEPITHMMVQARKRQLLSRTTSGASLSVPKDALYDRALDDLITETLLYQDAVSRGITADADAVEYRYNQTRSNYDSQQAYEERLAENHLTDGQFIENIRRQVVLLVYFDQLIQEKVLGSSEGLFQENEDGTRLRVEVETELTQDVINELSSEQFAKLEQNADIEVFSERIPEDA